MEYGLSIFASTASLTSSGTATATPIPFDTQGYFPRHIRVSTTADCYVAIGDLGVTAVAGDMLLQAGDAQLLHVSDCKAISILSVSGSATVTVAAMELGNWSTDQRTLDYNFTTLSAVPSTVTFTRGTGGGYFGSDGLFKWQGYNLLTYSQDLTNGAWGKSNCIVTGSDPSFLVTTSGLSHNVTNGIGGASGVTVTPNTQYTFTFYAKRGTMTDVKYSVYNITGAANIIAPTSYYSQINSDTETRITVSFTTPVGCTSINCFLLRDSGVTGTVYLGKPQLEAGSTANQYSPTTTAANSAPRLDYDPATLLPRGLLVEEQRTNSETNTAAITKGTAGDTATVGGGITGPDGEASIIHTANGASGLHWMAQGAITPTAGNTYTISVYLKDGTQTFVQVATGTAHSGATVYCNFDLSNANMTAGAGIVSGSNFCISVGNGWYRCGFSYVTSAAALGACVVTCAVTSLAAARLPNQAVSGTYYRWGGQYESTSGMGSATFATSYIPTTTAAATRSADSDNMTNTNFSSWYNAAAFTMVVQFVGNAVGIRTYWCISDGTLGQSIMLQSIAGTLTLTVTNVTTQATLNLGTIVTGTVYKVASAWAAADFASSVNGAAVVTATSGTLPTPNKFSIGEDFSNSNEANTRFARVSGYTSRLPNGTLVALAL